MYPWSKRLVLSLIWQDLYLGEYAGVNDSWMDVISSQGSSLLSVDLSGSDVTDFGLTYLKDCQSLISLNLNYCDQISDHGLECISGILTFPICIFVMEYQSMHLSYSFISYICICVLVPRHLCCIFYSSKNRRIKIYYQYSLGILRLFIGAEMGVHIALFFTLLDSTLKVRLAYSWYQFIKIFLLCQ